ncbi:MAG: DegV family protein [Lachnospiraceae bacterium]|nr:DegV family protein [Lachnospiraceae bacterium]
MVKILSDSTCDLSQELLEKYSINILPLHVLLGEKDYKDGVDITPEKIFSWSDKNKTTPKTAAPTIEDAVECMRPLLEQENELLCFAISESMSASLNVMRLAGEELEASDRVFTIDSQNLSTGIGLLIIEAACMAEAGMEAAEIAEKLQELKPRVRSSFVIDTLTYLHRGGRCSSMAALAGGMLKLHPKIVVQNGKMEVSKKYRGSLPKVVKSYVQDLEPELRNARPTRVFITHSCCAPELVKEVLDDLEQLSVFQEIIETRAGSVISSHCGPGTLGVLFIAR